MGETRQVLTTQTILKQNNQIICNKNINKKTQNLANTEEHANQYWAKVFFFSLHDHTLSKPEKLLQEQQQRSRVVLTIFCLTIFSISVAKSTALAAVAASVCAFRESVEACKRFHNAISMLAGQTLYLKGEAQLRERQKQTERNQASSI